MNNEYIIKDKIRKLCIDVINSSSDEYFEKFLIFIDKAIKLNEGKDIKNYKKKDLVVNYINFLIIYTRKY